MIFYCRMEYRFGGRLAAYLPSQREQQIVWLSVRTNWLQQSVVFTNLCDGKAVVVVHLGYGEAAATGEFYEIRLERVQVTGDRVQVTRYGSSHAL